MRSGYSFPDLADLDSDGWDSLDGGPVSFAGLSGGDDAPTAVRASMPDAIEKAALVDQVPFEEVQEDALTRVARPSHHRAPPPARAFTALDAPPVVVGESEDLVFQCATTPLDDSKPAANVRASRASFADGALSPFGPTANLRSTEGRASAKKSVTASPSEPPPAALHKKDVEAAAKKSSGPRLDLTMRSRKADVERAVAKAAAILVTEPVGHPVARTPAPAPMRPVGPGAPALYPTAPTPATSVAAARPPRTSRADDTGPRMPPHRRPTPSEPWSESPWVLSSNPSQPHLQVDVPPPPYGAPPRSGLRTELSMVAAVATGALAFCLILGAFFFTRQSQALPLEDTASAATAPAEGEVPVPVSVDGPAPASTTNPATADSSSTVPPPPATGTAKAPPVPTTAVASSDVSEPAPTPRPTKKPRTVKTDDGPRAAEPVEKTVEKTVEKPAKPSPASASSSAASSGSKKKPSGANSPKSLEQILNELGEEQLRR